VDIKPDLVLEREEDEAGFDGFESGESSVLSSNLWLASEDYLICMENHKNDK